MTATHVESRIFGGPNLYAPFAAVCAEFASPFASVLDASRLAAALEEAMSADIRRSIVVPPQGATFPACAAALATALQDAVGPCELPCALQDAGAERHRILLGYHDVHVAHHALRAALEIAASIFARVYGQGCAGVQFFEAATQDDAYTGARITRDKQLTSQVLSRLGLPATTQVGVADEVLAGIRAYTLCANDPPWSAPAPRVRPPARVVSAWNMDADHLATLIDGESDSDVVVGLGGGSAMDTAKYIAWRTGKRLVQIPSITSVDAAFTDAIGVRVDRKVKYVGRVVPERILLDLDLVRSAPVRLNRSGIGDVLSCYTGLCDWRLAAERGEGVPWDEDAAALGRALLAELETALVDVRAVSADGVRFLASAYRRIGAECARLRHSRFEEGSEHFLGYAYEHLTNAHPLHGELIAMCVVAMSELQGNDPDRARDLVGKSGVAAHPADVGMTREQFFASLRALPGYVRREGLDFPVVDVVTIDEATIDRLWRAVDALPRVSDAAPV